MGSPHHGGWLGDRVLPFLDRHTTHTQRARLPLVAACWTSLFVLCSLGTFLLGRGSDAQAEACAGTSYRDAGECDDRSDAAPVVSYSGILFPERAVFLVFGVPCAPLWFLTILLSGWLKASAAAHGRRTPSRLPLPDSRSLRDPLLLTLNLLDRPSFPPVHRVTRSRR